MTLKTLQVLLFALCVDLQVGELANTESNNSEDPWYFRPFLSSVLPHQQHFNLLKFHMLTSTSCFLLIANLSLCSPSQTKFLQEHAMPSSGEVLVCSLPLLVFYFLPATIRLFHPDPFPKKVEAKLVMAFI